MNVLVSLVAVSVLMGLAYFGTGALGLETVFAIVLPYLFIAIFFIGLISRVVSWAKSPVPFRIPTTVGQQKTLPWIKSSKIDSPHTGAGVVLRMALEVLLFRSLFRNTRAELNKEGPRVTYASNYWLWFFAIAFHYSFLIILVRHLRFFAEPVPGFVLALQSVDGFMQYGVPSYYITSVLLIGATGLLFLRRIASSQLRYISLASDYFPLFLILGIALTGFLLRHFFKTDIVAVKELTLGLASFSPKVPEGVSPLFYMHFFLVTVLFAYFPFSKLTHMAGVFLSPTRNLANNNREKRHINPWNPKVKLHSYEEYEDEFRDKMVGAGIPVDKE
ncbi:MAG: sulfate reduction electron transfer complex DsrMKJOP subunit DsrM [Myxococcota bacterium]|nr:sulfate reduction electron transfer complex DsrMKJOP subunit DsrM [Myxococcota bacterium]